MVFVMSMQGAWVLHRVPSMSKTMPLSFISFSLRGGWPRGAKVCRFRVDVKAVDAMVANLRVLKAATRDPTLNERGKRLKSCMRNYQGQVRWMHDVPDDLVIRRCKGEVDGTEFEAQPLASSCPTF